MTFKKYIYKKKEPEQINAILEKFIKSRGIEKKINENMAVVLWPDVVGEKIAQKTAALKVKNGILYIITSSPAWSQELSSMKSKLIEEINQKQKGEIIRDIRFRVGDKKTN